MRTLSLQILAVVVLAFGLSPERTASKAANASPSCSQLASNLLQRPSIKTARSTIVPASESNAAYCEVLLRYGANPDQNINIIVALPLSAVDGGKGGVQGAWNGRTQGLGGGGCSGNMFQRPFSDFYKPRVAINAGYVTSGNDLGHTGDSCEPGVNTDGTYNRQFIEDFFRNGVIQQVL